VASAGYWLLVAGRRSPEPLSKPTPLTTEPGFEQNASFSPDGSQVTFQWSGAEAPPHVFVKLVGQGDPIRLTSGTAAEYGPAWSPDGRFIAFLRDLGAEMMGIYVIPALGGVERKVAESPAPGYWALRHPLRRLDWTPDSRNLVVSGPDRPNGSERLLLLSVDSGEKRWLTAAVGDPAIGDREPAVSSDGRLIAFVRGFLGADEKIHVAPLRPDFTLASDPKPLTVGRNPAWTPDSSAIVFRVSRAYTFGLSRIAATGGRALELRELGDDALLPTVSRTGRLAYSRGVADLNIWRQEITTGEPLTPAVPLIVSTARDVDARYSPDGTRIAFQSNRSGRSEIWSCSSDGKHCGQLTAINRDVITGTPRWSPDGKSVAFDSAAEGRINVYTIEASGGPARRLTNNPAGGAIPSWSRDGKWIYYLSASTGRPEIWKVPSGGGPPLQITRDGGLVAFEAADGNALYYTKTETGATLWKSSLDGSNETRVVEGVDHRGFALTKDSLYYLHKEPDGETIRRLRFGSGENTLVVRVGRPLYLGLDVSPSGRDVIYSQFDQSGADLVLVEKFR
jgi:Tol biopolymer transport system component